MPGPLDFSSSFLPQQPLNSCLFPGLESRDSVNLVTNPHRFEVNGGLQFLGTAGQNVQDIRQYSITNQSGERSDAEEVLDVLQGTLEMRHLCPTAPDTLRAFPYVEEDPFVIHSSPHVYFCGNMDSYGERLVSSEVATCKQAVKIVSVPTFRKTRSIVLVDLTSL